MEKIDDCFVKELRKNIIMIPKLSAQRLLPPAGGVSTATPVGQTGSIQAEKFITDLYHYRTEGALVHTRGIFDKFECMDDEGLVFLSSLELGNVSSREIGGLADDLNKHSDANRPILKVEDENDTELTKLWEQVVEKLKMLNDVLNKTSATLDGFLEERKLRDKVWGGLIEFKDVKDKVNTDLLQELVKGAYLCENLQFVMDATEHAIMTSDSKLVLAILNTICIEHGVLFKRANQLSNSKLDDMVSRLFGFIRDKRLKIFI